MKHVVDMYTVKIQNRRKYIYEKANVIDNTYTKYSRV